jgi:phosphoglycolate phosphatase-like HAD superfamily hydrolase
MDILIFDMDGVLIDVSGSYRKTIKKSVQIYLQSCLGFYLKGKNPITNEEISLFKSVGGFNNDWDLTSGILLYLFSISGLPPLKKKKPFSLIEEISSFLQEETSKFQLNSVNLFKRKNIKNFLNKVKSYGGGIKGIRYTLSNLWDGWLYGEGDLNRENLVKRIFQEIYLGSKFRELYKLDPIFYHGKGKYLNERLLIPRRILLTLGNSVKMGIASGRPRFEAELVLKRFKLLPLFSSIVTLDDCIQEEEKLYKKIGRRLSLTKPHPYSILRVIKEIGLKNPKSGYIGDIVDDMVAANLAKKETEIIAIGFINRRKCRNVIKDSLINAGADMIIERPEDLLKLITL